MWVRQGRNDWARLRLMVGAAGRMVRRSGTLRGGARAPDLCPACGSRPLSTSVRPQQAAAAIVQQGRRRPTTAFVFSRRVRAPRGPAPPGRPAIPGAFDRLGDGTSTRRHSRPIGSGWGSRHTHFGVPWPAPAAPGRSTRAASGNQAGIVVVRNSFVPDATAPAGGRLRRPLGRQMSRRTLPHCRAPMTCGTLHRAG